MAAFSTFSTQQFVPMPTNLVPAVIQDIGKELGCEAESHLIILTKALEVIRNSKRGQSQGERNPNQGHSGSTVSSTQHPNMSSFPMVPSPVLPLHQFPPMPNGCSPMPQMFPRLGAPSPQMSSYGHRMPMPFPNRQMSSFQEWQAVQAFRQQQQFVQASGTHKIPSPVIRQGYRPHPYAFHQPVRTVPQMRQAYSPEQSMTPIPEQKTITDADLDDLSNFLSNDFAPAVDNSTTVQTCPLPVHSLDPVAQKQVPMSQEPIEGISDEELAEMNEYCLNLKRERGFSTDDEKKEEKRADFSDNGIDRDLLNEFFSFA